MNNAAQRAWLNKERTGVRDGRDSSMIMIDNDDINTHNMIILSFGFQNSHMF